MNAATQIDTVYFSVKGQVVIPRRLRKEFEIGEGTRAYVQSTPEGILIRPLTAKHIHSLRGSLKGSKAMEVFTSERKKERDLNMATKVLDSWALMAFLHDEPAAGEVEKLLVKAAEDKHELLLCVVNWGEIYYSIARAEGEAVAEQKAADLATLAIELVPVSNDLELVREAARLKASKKMAYADCFAAALAKLRNAEVVTGDPEFKEVDGEVKVAWLPNN